jgi:hypothetical protein
MTAAIVASPGDWTAEFAALRSDTQTPREETSMPQPHPLVMITGASSGIGRALAFAFAAEGNPLLLVSRHIEPIGDTPGEHRLPGRRCR